MLRCAVQRRAASAAEVEAAFSSLGNAPGIYFGCDAGIAGMHPMQATLLTRPIIEFAVHADALHVRALDDIGAGLLRHQAMRPFMAACEPASGRSPIDALRAFLAAFDGCAEAMLVGALRFEAHRLAGCGAPAAAPRDSSESLGVLYFSKTLLRRDVQGAWQELTIDVDDVSSSSLRAAASLPAAASFRKTAPLPASSSFAAAASVPSVAPRREPRTAAADRGRARDRCHDDFAPGGYAEVVARAAERLAREPLVSLTLSQSFRRELGSMTPAAAFASLRSVNPAPATFFVGLGDGSCVFGASPDLQLVVEGKDVTALPVCGTVARGHGPVGEADSLRALLNETVDAASLAVCTDALRNDLAPLCEPGSLRLRDRLRPMALATVVHTVDRLSGRLRGTADAWDAIVATTAPVMVTGTPRRRALAAIGELEASPRGWYGGLVVQVAANGDAMVGTLLRAASIRDGQVEVRSGGDLLADSDPEREELESRVKAVSLWRALGLPVDADLRSMVADTAAKPRPTGTCEPATTALQDAGDPFAGAMADTLAGLGVAIDPAASTVVVIGGDEALCRAACTGGRGIVAIGDAACRVLQQRGLSPSRRLADAWPLAGLPGHGRCAGRPAGSFHGRALRDAGDRLGRHARQRESNRLVGLVGGRRWRTAGVGQRSVTNRLHARSAPTRCSRTRPPATCFALRSHGQMDGHGQSKQSRQSRQPKQPRQPIRVAPTPSSAASKSSACERSFRCRATTSCRSTTP